MTIAAQYIVVRKDLATKYGLGVLAAQAAHASVAPLTSQLRGNLDAPVREAIDRFTREWVEGTFRKIVLEAESEQDLLSLMERLRSDGVHFSEIRESSLNGQLTAIGLRPCNKGAVAHYFTGFKLLGRSATRLMINGQEWSSHDVGYDALSIATGVSDPRNRFLLEARLSGQAFPARIDLALRQRLGVEVADAFLDQYATVPFLEMVRRNDPRFAKYLMTAHFRTIFDDVLRPNGTQSVILTSVDALFAVGNMMFVAGGCRLDQ